VARGALADAVQEDLTRSGSDRRRASTLLSTDFMRAAQRFPAVSLFFTKVFSSFDDMKLQGPSFRPQAAQVSKSNRLPAATLSAAPPACRMLEPFQLTEYCLINVRQRFPR